ncbi:MAG: hypothetical protein ACOYLS_09855 [Polymorphobacter sp.]
MVKFALIIALNIAFFGWILYLAVRDPANVWKRRDRDVPPPGDGPDAG